MNGPSFHDLADGRDIVIQKYARPPLFAVATVRFDEHRRLASLELSNGEAISVVRRPHEELKLSSADGATWWLYYTLPLPAGSEADRIDYARTLRGESTQALFGITMKSEWDTTCAFLIETVGDDVVTARMVSNLRSWTHTNEEGVEELSFKALDESDIVFETRKAGAFWKTEDAVTIERSTLPADLEPGHVLAATDIDVVIEEGRETTRLANAYRLPFKATYETLDSVFPRVTTPDDEGTVFPRKEQIALTPVARWVFERECARRASEPNIALIVAIPSDDRPECDSERIGIIAHSGELVYRNYEHVYEGLVTSGGIQPGVALMTEPRFWSYRSHEGEHDGGFEFGHEPAGDEALATFAMSVGDLGSAIRGFLEEEEDAELYAFEDEELGRHFLALNARRQEPAATPVP
jgi:hypothetical protein|nr:hypothetical protein [Neorhizobium tomejilense]